MKALFPIIVAILLTACGGSSSQSTPAPIPEPAAANLSALTVVDAGGRPIANAEVSITKQTSGPAALSSIQSNLVTDENGHLVLNNLTAGRYQLSITVGEITVTSSIEIALNNASESAVVPAPIDYVDGDYIELDPSTLLLAISGTVYSADGFEANAEVSISGGDITNGAIATDITDEKGRYSLILNIGINATNQENLKKSSLRVVKTGFVDVSKTLDITSIDSLIGFNIALTADKKNNATVVYADDFNNTLSGATCGGWTATNNWEDDYVLPLAQVTNVGWHAHGNNKKIKNQALSNNLVQLAADDESAGYVPDPVSGKACWYGQTEAGIGQGNFLGATEITDGGTENDGGTSDVANSGVLTSPALNFAKEKGPLALTFKTFWEIESVNPNENGFDLMLIEISKDNGATWQNIARLNPLSDPTYGDDYSRAAMPFSNRGFNRAPAWLSQEPIDISELAGESDAKIRFVFSTEDHLYNGFRGWLIDDVQVIRKAGTFPRYSTPSFDDFCEEYAEFCNFCDEYPEYCDYSELLSNTAKVRAPAKRNINKNIAR